MATPTIQGAFKALQLIHKAMLAGQFIFAVVAIILVYLKIVLPPLTHLNELLQVLVLSVGAIGYFAGNYLFKKKLSAARELLTGVKEKFELYRAGCMAQWVMLEVPTMLALICFILTGNYAFVALAALLILLFSMMAPSGLKAALQLRVSENELSQL